MVGVLLTVARKGLVSKGENAMADKAKRGNGESYGGGSEFRIAGMTRAETQAALEKARAVKDSHLSFAQKVDLVREKLNK